MKRNILTALLSVAIAFGLWLYVITVVSPDSDITYHGVSVVLQGEAILEERGLIITTGEMPTVSLRLEGNRSELQKLNSSNISITIDVSKIVAPGEHKLPVSPSNIRLPGDVSYSAITVASRKPDYIKLIVQERVDKPVPVEVIPTTSDNYTVDEENYQLDHSEIQVSGPSDVVSRIKKARIYPDLREETGLVTENLAITLCDEQGNAVESELVTTNVGMVELTVQMLRIKQVALDVEIVDGGGATAKDLHKSLNPVYMNISGTEEELAKWDTIFVGKLELADVWEDGSRQFPIVLPAGLHNESDITEVVVEFQFIDLVTKTLDITSIEGVNMPEGMVPNFTTQSLQIQFRGPKALMETLKPEHVTVVVDFAGTYGEMSWDAVVRMAPGYEQVAALGGYMVDVFLE